MKASIKKKIREEIDAYGKAAGVVPLELFDRNGIMDSLGSSEKEEELIDALNELEDISSEYSSAAGKLLDIIAKKAGVSNKSDWFNRYSS